MDSKLKALFCHLVCSLCWFHLLLKREFIENNFRFDGLYELNNKNLFKIHHTRPWNNLHNSIYVFWWWECYNFYTFWIDLSIFIFFRREFQYRRKPLWQFVAWLRMRRVVEATWIWQFNYRKSAPLPNPSSSGCWLLKCNGLLLLLRTVSSAYLIASTPLRNNTLFILYFLSLSLHSLRTKGLWNYSSVKLFRDPITT